MRPKEAQEVGGSQELRESGWPEPAPWHQGLRGRSDAGLDPARRSDREVLRGNRPRGVADADPFAP